VSRKPYVISKEERKRRSERMSKSNPMKNPEIRERHLIACQDSERREKISAKNKGKVFTEEHKQKLSEKAKLRTGDKGSGYGKHNKHSEETKKKISIASIGKHCGEKNPMYGKHPVFTEEHKQKISEATRGRKVTPETRKRISDATKKRMTPEMKKRISDSLKGRKRTFVFTEEYKKILSERMKNNKIFEGMHHTSESKKKIGDANRGEKSGLYGKPATHSKGVWFYYNGNYIWLRSGWEVHVALTLNRFNIIWEYEPKAFPLTVNGKKTTYRPDFYLPEHDIWIEIKGWWRDDALAKFEQFSIQYPAERSRTKLLYKDDIAMLDKMNKKEEILCLT